MITITRLQELGYRKVKTSTARGYVSRKMNYVVQDYKGRYGEGYKVLYPRYDTTRYCTCEYWVRG